jgi:hypothetical protein
MIRFAYSLNNIENYLKLGGEALVASRGQVRE